MADSMDSVFIFSLPEKDNLQLYQNYRNIRLLSHQSKVIVKVNLNRLNTQPEEIISRFRAVRSVSKNILKCEKCVQHQKNLYHVFIDLKKTFDMGMTCTLMGYHFEIHHQCQSTSLY